MQIGREILRVREQHRPGVADPVMEADFAFGGLGFEIGSGIADLQRHDDTSVAFERQINALMAPLYRSSPGQQSVAGEASIFATRRGGRGERFARGVAGRRYSRGAMGEDDIRAAQAVADCREANRAIRQRARVDARLRRELRPPSDTAPPCRNFAMATPRHSLARALAFDLNQNDKSCD